MPHLVGREATSNKRSKRHIDVLAEKEKKKGKEMAIDLLPKLF